MRKTPRGTVRRQGADRAQQEQRHGTERPAAIFSPRRASFPRQRDTSRAPRRQRAVPRAARAHGGRPAASLLRVREVTAPEALAGRVDTSQGRAGAGRAEAVVSVRRSCPAVAGSGTGNGS